MPKIQVNGIHLYYEIVGQGKLLVLIAGLTCDTSFWLPILNGLKAHFQLLVFDNRDVGRSDCVDKSYTIVDMSNDTIELIQKLGLQKPHILGHSMGGCIAQTIALNHRDQVDKIIISNSLIKMNHASSRFQKFILKLRQEGCSIQTLAEGVLPWIFSSHFLADEKRCQELISMQVNHPYPQTLSGFKRQLEALLAFDSTQWLKLKQMKGPALIIGSDEDIFCPRESEELANYIEDAKFVDFHRIGHCPMIEKPKEYIGIITNYLK